jgi:hypothetical protein
VVAELIGIWESWHSDAQEQAADECMNNAQKAALLARCFFFGAAVIWSWFLLANWRTTYVGFRPQAWWANCGSA